jgi:hypothetical protein
MEREREEIKIIKFISPENFLGFYIELYKICHVLDLNCSQRRVFGK